LIVNLTTNGYQSIEGDGRIGIGLRTESKRNRCDNCGMAKDDARKHGMKKTILPLTCDSCVFVEGNYVILQIEDTGKGINSDVADRIFEPFFTTKPVGEGSGMGLAMVHGIVQSHGGGINISSELGKGTIFEVVLPAINVSEDSESLPPQTETARSNSLSILLVDDEEAIINMGRRMLSRLGHQVTAFSSSEEALKRYLESPQAFDIVVSDYNMPALNGVGLLERIREKNPKQAFVLMTGLKDRSIDSLENVTVLSKPILRKELLEALMNVHQGRKQETECN